MYLVLFLVPKPTVVGTLSSVRRGDSIPFSSASSKTLEFPQPYKRSSNNQTMVSLYGNGVERVMMMMKKMMMMSMLSFGVVGA
jgi:hypothetical protein